MRASVHAALVAAVALAAAGGAAQAQSARGPNSYGPGYGYPYNFRGFPGPNGFFNPYGFGYRNSDRVPGNGALLGVQLERTSARSTSSSTSQASS